MFEKFKPLYLNRIDLWAASVVRGSMLVAQNDWTGKQKDLVDRRMDAFNAMSALLAL